MSCSRCGKCCCKFASLSIGVDDIPYEMYEVEEGHAWMKKGDDGNCIALDGKLCSIHDRKPVACRAYDCEKG